VSCCGLVLAGLFIIFMKNPSLLLLYSSLGFLLGLGFGFMYLPAMTVIQLYFDKRLGMAMGLATSGSGVGQVVLAPVIQLLHKQLDLGKTFFVLAAIVLIPLVTSQAYAIPDELKAEVYSKTNRKKEKICEIEHEKSGKSGEKSYFTILLEAIRCPAFACLLASHFLGLIPVYTGYIFTADRALSFGVEESKVSSVLSAIGLGNFLGRIFGGKLLDIFRTKKFILVTLFLLTHSVCLIISNYVESYIGQVVFGGIFGLTFGWYSSSFMVIIKELSAENITERYGLIMFVFSLASLAAPPFVGVIFDVTASYRPGFLMTGLLGVAGGLLVPAVHYLLTKSSTKSTM